MYCKHRMETGRPDRAKCAIGNYDRNPLNTDCLACSDYSGPVRGAGDIIAKITKKVGIKPCGGCQKRREKLNKMLPLGGHK